MRQVQDWKRTATFAHGHLGRPLSSPTVSHRRARKNRRRLVVGVAASLWATGCSVDVQSENAQPETPGLNRVDVMFAQMMVPHHDDAIAMANYLQDVSGVDPRVEELAAGIVRSQERENEKMNSWLTERGYPTVDEGPARVNEESVAGQSADQAEGQFLTEMIAHHEHGVDMAQGAVRRGQSPVMTDLAQQMVDDQSREIEQMRDLLAEQ